MYKLHLILKYLRKRRIAWVSLIAVTLCTAMVLIVLSVMGGWLRMFLGTSRALAGDVVIYSPSATGFGHYEEILADVRKMPQVKAAIPVITAYGVANFNDQYQNAVMVKAYGDLDQVGRVNSFQRSLWRQYERPMQEIQQDAALSAAEKERRKSEVATTQPNFDKPLDADTYREYLPGKPGYDTSTLPGIIASTPLILRRNAEGKYDRPPYIYHSFITLTVGDLTTAGSSTPDVSSITYWIVDDCHTGFWPVDNNTVYVPFDRLQKALGMSQRTYQEKVGGQLMAHVDPARVTEIQVSLQDGIDVYAGRDAIAAVVSRIESQHADLSTMFEPLRVESWDQRQADFISAVVHEKVLLTFLFAIVSIVAVFLIFCIFYMIVAEKTRDVGILKSIGASNWGVAQVFLGYGLAIGLIGGGMGLLSAYLVVHNINALHAWMTRVLHVTVWDPKTYIFDTIPNTMESGDVIWIVSIAVLSAVIGALIPAIRAGRMNPVEAMRWE